MPPRKKTAVKKQKRDDELDETSEETPLERSLMPPYFTPFRKESKLEKDATAARRNFKKSKQMISAERFDYYSREFPSYQSIEAAPSVLPRKKYCDFTGLPAMYSDPKTRIRYCKVSLFKVIRSLPHHIVEEILEFRKANVALK